jgi:hypothetical protein
MSRPCVRVHQHIIPDDMSVPSPAVLGHLGQGKANFAYTAFSEDEMRRPTPYAVPFGSAKAIRALTAQRGGSAHYGW